MVNVAASLRASSAAFYRAGQEFSAIMAKEMAAQCERMGAGGEALYRHWAGELAARAEIDADDGTRAAAFSPPPPTSQTGGAGASNAPTISPESRVGLDPDAGTRQHGEK